MKGFKSDKRKQDEGDAGSQFNLRINLFFFSTFIIFCVIIVRLAFLQFVEGPELTEQETGGRTKNFPLQPIRGSIIDASGTPLAYSKPSNALYVTLLKNYNSQTEKGRENLPEIEAFAEKMYEVFEKHGAADAEELTVEDIIERLDLDSKKQGGYEPRRIKGELTDDEVAYFIENKDDFPGVEIVEENVRYYDEDTVAVQTIGYLKEFKGAKTKEKYKEIDEANKDQKDPGLKYTETEWVGYDGLEMMFQDELRGKNGYMSIPINPQNMIDGTPTLVAPEKGNDVYTTIHKEIQMKAEQAVVDQLEWLRTTPFSGRTHQDAKTGYAVAMEVDTGNIVAMVSIPDYDPNVWKDGADQEEWDKVTSSMGNGTISPYSSGRSANNLESVLLLGSTVKPLSVLIGLNEGFFGVNSYYYDKGYAEFGGDKTKVRNSQSKAFGLIDPALALQNSSNAFMIDMVGKQLFNKYGAEGINVWDKYMKEFGLGVSTEVGLPGEFLGTIEYTNIEQAGSPLAALAFASFGQSGKYSTMQLAQYATTLANRGVRIKPQLVSEIKDQEGNVVKKFEREVLNEVTFPDEYWDEVIKGMNTQVPSFADFGYDFARKTGTSQQDVYINGKRIQTDNGVFIGFAPRENPKLAVAVIIPEGGFGAYSAAPVARKIFDAYDEVYGLDGTPHPKNTETSDENASDAGSTE
ncbi:peptidoglycan D,D-transpeptidase FtsI family protein [Paenibacillus sp. GCM10028914]|uniref:peptidoglycan D,D-transpeptidase FtsI family protein n=1 Tax=Paenibacillus sp. GCM10028914 TaxID=3273416 RepID=UPI003608762A